MKNGALKIRSALSKHSDALSGLLQELGFPSTKRDITARLRTLRGSALVAVRGGEVIGLITTNIMPVLHRPTPVGRLSALVVSKQERGKGVGRALVAAAEQKLKKQGCTLTEVTSNVRLKRAHSFYKHLGYERTSFRFKKAIT